MNEQHTEAVVEKLERRRIERRGLFQRVGAGAASAVAMGALATVGVTAGSTPALAATDADVLNFALNLEYLEAEFYLRAVTGAGLPASATTGVGTQGAVTGGSQVPFRSTAIQQYASRIAVDEQAHVLFLRAVLGANAVAEPAINLSTSFTGLAIAAGLIVPGQTFNPFADDVSFLLGASIFEDVGVTAYAGAAGLLTNATYITAAASILAVEAYHSGAVRSLLADLGAGLAFDMIANLRQNLSNAVIVAQTEQPILLNSNQSYNFVPNDSNGLAFRRTTGQVLNIVYGGGAPSNFLFFPNRVNGTIQS